MFISIKKASQATLLGLGLIGAASNRADADLILSAEAAGVQNTTLSGVTTETFDGFTPGRYSANGANLAVGTLTASSVAIMAADQYGGAGGKGNYFAIGAESNSTTATLNLKGAESYFGFYWSAADKLNEIDFYSKGNLIGKFWAATALASLGSAYYGNPNSGADAGEKFAYINITGTNGTTIDQVVFNNASSTATGFEADNFSIKATSTGPTGTIINGGISAVPEPGSLVLASIGGLVATGGLVRRRRRAKVNA